MTALATLRRMGGLARPSWQATSATLQSRSSSIRNDSMQAAVAGSPGTLPTNWSTSLSGLTQTVAGIGTENGVDYIDLRFSGTTSGTSVNIFFDTTVAIAASNGQTWVASLFVKLVGGGFTNITAVRNIALMRDGGGASLGSVLGASIAGSITSALTRFSDALLLNNASTAFVQPLFQLAVTNGAAVDITLRIGWPMLHQGVAALSPIRTAGTARSGVHASRRERV